MDNLAPIPVASTFEAVRKAHGLPSSSSALLGEGTYGVVREMGGFALKKFRVTCDDEGLDASSIREISVYQYLATQAPDITPKPTSIIISDEYPNGAILMEKYPHTLHSSPAGVTETNFVDIARSLIEKLCTWSKLGLSHRDLKPQNMVYDPTTGRVRVIDWGAANFKHWPSPEYGLTTQVCTLWYRCPEILMEAKEYDPTALDVWSMGASLVHIWGRIKSCVFDLAGDNEIDTLLRIFKLVGSPTSEGMKKLPVWNDKLPKFPTRKASATYKLPDDLLSDLVDKMLVTDPCNRITIDGIMRHPFMAASSIVIPVKPCRVRADIMAHQSDINNKMRQILIDWLISVASKFKLKMETLVLTIEIIDDMILRKMFIRQKLQLLGVTAMLIASKLLECFAPEVRDYVYITDKAYTREQIVALERVIMTTVPDLYTIMSRGPGFIVAKATGKTDITGWIAALLGVYDVKYSSDNMTELIAAVVASVEKGSCEVPERVSSSVPRCTGSSLRDAHNILTKLSITKPVMGTIDAVFFGPLPLPLPAPLIAPPHVPTDKPPLHPPAPPTSTSMPAAAPTPTPTTRTQTHRNTNTSNQSNRCCTDTLRQRCCMG